LFDEDTIEATSSHELGSESFLENEPGRTDNHLALMGDAV